MKGLRQIGLILVIVLLATGCTTMETPAPVGEATSTTSSPSTTLQTSTTLATTTTEQPVDVTAPPPELHSYAVVAEERARRLAVLDPSAACPGDEEECELEPVLTIELPERPHNLTAAGAVVYATHPAAGSISRVDLAGGETITTALGTEPHDVKYAPAADLLYVADEAGRAVLVVDPDSLAVVAFFDMPGEPHDLIVSEDAIWVTLRRRSELARIVDDEIELFPTSGSPHDLILDGNGMIWFSNWGSDVLNLFDPSTGETVEAPAGVTEPHHFAIGPDGAVWVSDNGGSAIVGFVAEQPLHIEVGPVPHHLGFVGNTLVVAVSGSGEAVLVEGDRVVGRVALSSGLHGVAVAELVEPIGATRDPDG